MTPTTGLINIVETIALTLMLCNLRKKTNDSIVVTTTSATLNMVPIAFMCMLSIPVTVWIMFLLGIIIMPGVSLTMTLKVNVM